jgi:hypothetical protein
MPLRQPTKLPEDRLDEAYVRGRTMSEKKEVGPDEGFGVLPAIGPIIKAQLDAGGEC